MRSLVPDDEEPITPYVARVESMFRRHGVSSVMVMGGCGEYFELANVVLRMKDYRAIDASEQAHAVSRRIPGSPFGRDIPAFASIPRRRIESVDVPPESMGSRRARTAAAKGKTIRLAKTVIDLSVLDQLVDESQVRAIAELVRSNPLDVARRGDEFDAAAC